MLTEAQQKVKQELEELKVNRILFEKARTVSPVSSQPKIKWPIWVLAILTGSFIICFFAVSLTAPSSINISSYLSKELDYNKKSAKLLANSLSHPTLDAQQAKKEQRMLWDQANHLSVPVGFKDHQQDFLSLLEHRQMILTYLSETGTVNPNILNRYQLELEVKQELALDSLTKAFNKQNIPYHIHDDGSIQYWIGQKPFDYNIKQNP
ncbi:hypothetical protein [Neobacillus muris]|uniref:hypothetical protein n=1 Tax=Neobacillus muris TaxID=2941334 RepID=UPI002041BA0B|nr:hypothetical protein [Neobacillus muris]